MGLDISWYRNVKLAPDAALDEDGYPVDWETYTRLGKSNYPERCSDLEEGVYSFDASGSFRAGSYSSYNNWREELAKLAGYLRHEAENSERHKYSAGAWVAGGGPFYELIHFADNEGVIGPLVSAKLAKDFAEFEDQANEVSDMPWFAGKFAEWRTAFENAAQNGFVDFH